MDTFIYGSKRKDEYTGMYVCMYVFMNISIYLCVRTSAQFLIMIVQEYL
jgi:hypothetical protein